MDDSAPVAAASGSGEALLMVALVVGAGDVVVVGELADFSEVDCTFACGSLGDVLAAIAAWATSATPTMARTNTLIGFPWDLWCDTQLITRLRKIAITPETSEIQKDMQCI